MKRLTTVIMVILCYLNSCCTKKKCDDFEKKGWTEIKLSGFSPQEVDTLVVYIYQKGNATNVLDSAQYHPFRQDSAIAFLGIENGVNPDYDYKFKLSGNTGSYLLHNIETTKEGCNTCFPYRPKSDLVTKLNGYSINGIKKTGSEIVIEK